MILAFSRVPGALYLAIGAPVPYGYVFIKEHCAIVAVEATLSGDVAPWLGDVERWIAAHSTPGKSERPDLWHLDKLAAARVAAEKLRALLPREPHVAP
jgi:hypothetical protein